MKAVMISIRPEWCELIASGKKTIELRKTRPNVSSPFKCYIYQTQPKKSLVGVLHDGDELYGEIYRGKTAFIKTYKGVSAGSRTFGTWGKVIGEFVCDKNFNVYEFSGSSEWLNESLLADACMSAEDAKRYAGNSVNLFGWHISNLKIYDKPRELSEFFRHCDFAADCGFCEHAIFYGHDFHDCGLRLTRPPQSWCYVEETE